MATVSSLPALEELKRDPQWVCFDEHKVPFSPTTGMEAKANDPTTWGLYAQAVKTWRSNKSKYKGLGREFVKEQHYTGIDLDKCFDEHGNLTPYARYVVHLLDSYTEYSPSGQGLHIWVRGVLPDNINTEIKADGECRIEAYDCKRYFTVTGKHFPGTPPTIEDRQVELDALYAETMERREATRKPRTRGKAPAQSSTGDTSYGLGALDDECRELASTPEGGRNPQLNRCAYKIGQLVGGNALTRITAENALYDAAVRTGLPEREIIKTLRSGIEAGIREPRSVPIKELPGIEYKPTHNISGESTNGNGHHLREEQNGTSEQPVPAGDPLCEFSADDAGNADALFFLYGQDFLWCASHGWFTYCGTHWQHDVDGTHVRTKAVETLRRRRVAAVLAEKEPIVRCTKADVKRVDGCVSLFKTLTSASIDTFDRHPDMLNCQNGMLDLRTATLTPHDRSQRFTYCLPVAYDEQADYTAWHTYLLDVIGENTEILDYLQEAAGYSLTGHTREEVLFYLYGPPRSGKGTFAETFMALLPSPISKMVDFNSFTAKREGDVSNFDLAPLKPSRIIFASESNRSQSLNPAKIKQLTGGDTITCSFKHRDFFDYRPRFKVWMMSNHPVNGDPEDDALWSRVRVIEFPNSFLGKEDKSKKERLRNTDALQGVLAWAVEGAITWYGRGSAGLSAPASIVKVTQEQRDELDYVQQWLDECCTEGEWTANELVTASYLAWCKNNNVQFPKGPKALTQSLKAKGYQIGQQKKIDGKNKKGVEGLYVLSVEGNICGNGNDW